MIVNREKILERIKNVFPFNLVDAELITSIVDHSDVVFFKSGDMVYLEGAAAKYLYVIFEGEVEILKEIDQALQKKNQLHAGDLFGEDVFAEVRVRRTSARAAQDTLLIRIGLAVFTQLFQKDHASRGYFELLQNSNRLLTKTRQEIHFERETIHYIGQPHKLFLVFKSLFGLAAFTAIGTGLLSLSSYQIIPASVAQWASVILFIVYLISLGWNIYEWSNDLYFFTDRRVINQEQGLLFYESRDETPLDAIMSLDCKMNILGRQYGFGDLYIKTYTGSFRLKNVPLVSAAQKLLEYLIDKEGMDKRRNEKDEFENLVRERKGMEPKPAPKKVTEGGEQQPFKKRPGPVSSLLSRLFGLKQVNEDAIIYRTHWICLLRKTIFPFLILLSLIFTLLYLYAIRIDIAQNPWAFGAFSILVIASAMWWLYQYMDWRNDQYIVAPDQIIDLYRKPLGTEDRRTAPLESIQSIRYKREGLLGLALNYGTVLIKVGNEDFSFDNVYDPFEVQQTLFGYLEQSNSMKKKTNLAEQQRQMADWMDAYQRVAKKNPENDQD
jgi:membrane protein YdbS with pleckstrin-like domain